MTNPSNLRAVRLPERPKRAQLRNATKEPTR